MRLFKLGIISLSLLLLPLISYSYEFTRVIKNQSNKPWIIVASPQPGYHLKFDSLSPRVEGVCGAGSWLEKGCFLAPGKTTFVNYSRTGELIFTDAISTFIVVTYKINKNGVGMKSSWERRINDNHGDITIFS